MFDLRKKRVAVGLLSVMGKLGWPGEGERRLASGYCFGCCYWRLNGGERWFGL